MNNQLLDPVWVGKTFDDFLFRPQKGASSSRAGISLSSRLSASVGLELPIVSSNMDSVTGGDMAQTMALEGGLGVIHRGQSIERQCETVAGVKRSHSAVIEQPRTLPLGSTIGEARVFARRHKINGILIETAPGSAILAGVLTRRDIPWDRSHDNEAVENFMTPMAQLKTAGPDVATEDAERIMFEGRIERLPLVDDECRIHGLITRKDVRFLRERPFASKDAKGRLLTGAAVGCAGDFMERAQALLEAGADSLFVDIAHGHSLVMQQGIERLRAEFPEAPLICGNVATGAGARFMCQLGADAVKVGVGPGRGCRTGWNSCRCAAASGDP